LYESPIVLERVGYGYVSYFSYPSGTGFTIVFLVSGFLYYKIASAMKAKVKTGKEEMIGEEAVVIKDINPEGKVTVWSEIWSATGNGKQFRKGQKVKICGVCGLTAVVCESLEE
jgi:membrane-bound ClpP family serine protease